EKRTLSPTFAVSTFASKSVCVCALLPLPLPVPVGQPDEGAGMMSPCAWCAGIASCDTTIKTHGFDAEPVAWQIGTPCPYWPPPLPPPELPGQPPDGAGTMSFDDWCASCADRALSEIVISTYG